MGKGTQGWPMESNPTSRCFLLLVALAMAPAQAQDPCLHPGQLWDVLLLPTRPLPPGSRGTALYAARTAPDFG